MQVDEPSRRRVHASVRHPYVLGEIALTVSAAGDSRYTRKMHGSPDRRCHVGAHPGTVRLVTLSVVLVAGGVILTIAVDPYGTHVAGMIGWLLVIAGVVGVFASLSLWSR